MLASERAGDLRPDESRGDSADRRGNPGPPQLTARPDHEPGGRNRTGEDQYGENERPNEDEVFASD